MSVIKAHVTEKSQSARAHHTRNEIDSDCYNREIETSSPLVDKGRSGGWGWGGACQAD